MDRSRNFLLHYFEINCLTLRVKERKQGRMGEGEEVKTRDESNVEIKERGEIFMVYRPKVNKEEAHSEDDVQRLYIVLRPESKPGDNNPSSSSSSSSSSSVELKQSGDEADDGSRSGGHGAEEVNIQKQTLMRLIVMGRKSLPPTSKKGRPHWGFVELVTTDVAQLKSALQPEEYDTSTRGHRRKPAARAMGEGVYRILTHNPSDSSSASKSKTHTHLIYKLHIPGGNNISPPTKDDTPQHALNVEPEASFLIQIKNPSPKHERGGGGGGFRGVESKRKATFPATLQGLFGNRAYVPADPPDFLNYEGCELLLISASDDISGELGIELKTHQHVSSQPSSSSDDECCSSFVHTFGEDSGLPTTPLFQRTWA